MPTNTPVLSLLSTEGLGGAKKFVDRIWRLYTSENKIKDAANQNLEKIYNETVKKVTEDYETLNFNTAISQMMIFVNAVYREETFPEKYAEGLLKMLNPVAPFVTEELWQRLGHKDTIAYEKWPTFDDSKIQEDTFELVIQVNGKVRDKMTLEKGLSNDKVQSAAMQSENVKRALEGKKIVKVIVVPNKIINFAVTDK